MKNKIKKAALTLVGLALAYAPMKTLAQDPNSVDPSFNTVPTQLGGYKRKETEDTPKDSDQSTNKSVKPSFLLSTTYATDWVAKAGFIIGNGPVNQSLVAVNFDKITAFAWGNYDITDQEFHEVDLGITYSEKLGELPGGDLSARIDYQNWQYPSELLGDHDNILEAGVNYVSNAINLDTTVTHALDVGTMIHATLSKNIPITESISVTPTLQAAFLDDYFGTDGFSHLTPGLGASVKLGDLTLDAYIKRQFSQQDSFKDRTFAGISISYRY